MRLNSAIGYITPRTSSPGISRRFRPTGSEIEGGEGTAEEAPPACGVADEVDYFRIGDRPGTTITWWLERQNGVKRFASYCGDLAALPGHAAGIASCIRHVGPSL